MSEQASARETRLTFEGTGARQVRATALGRGTHGVPDVRRMVESQFHIAFPHRVWVAGEVGAPFDADDGLRFALHPSTGDDVFSLPCLVPSDGVAAVRDLLHRSHDADLEDVVREGRLARVGGLLRYDAARGAVVFLVSELDPTPTALELAGAREAALQHVVGAGLATRQRRLDGRTAPLEVAVVAAPADAARAQEQLAQSRYDVHLAVHPVVLTGKDAPAVLAGAVRAAGADGDVVLLLRAQGRPLGLATYDALEVADAVADCPVPVVAALGGAGTRTATDEVAWASLPAPTDALGWLLERLGEAEAALEALTGEVAEAVEDAGARCRSALLAVAHEAGEAGEQAAVRAEQVRRRRRLALRVGCALLVAAVVAAAVVTGRPLVLLGLLVPVVVLVGTELWWRSPTRRRTKRMSSRDDDFTQVLGRLSAVRDELRTTRSPERVAVLRDLAGELVADGERLLGVHLDRPPSAQDAGAERPEEPPARDSASPADAPATRQAGPLTGGSSSRVETTQVIAPTSPGAARTDAPSADATRSLPAPAADTGTRTGRPAAG